MVDWRLGDTDDLKKWIEKLAGASDEKRTEIADIKTELRGIRQSVEALQNQVDHMEQILSRGIGVRDMNTRLTGIIREGDTRDLKEWIEKIAGASAERTTEMTALREELREIRQEMRAMQKQLDTLVAMNEKFTRMEQKLENIGNILEKVSD